VGSSVPANALELSTRGLQVHGVDASPRAIEAADAKASERAYRVI
jgi:2-polyprenyl-3-methyl-5-hydroxy-6-metoxy-1,4-benzoquinol methylase